MHARINPNLSVDYESLHNFSGRYNNYGYAAVGVPTAMRQKPTHRKDVSNRYYESVKDGAEELTWFLEDRMTSCPLQQIVLGGFSQGAEVVGDALNMMQPEFRPRVAYAAFYGDPKFNPAQALLPPISGPWRRGTASITTHGILNARRKYIPDGVLSAGSWCQRGDTICDAGQFDANDPGNWLYDKLGGENVHSQAYTNTWIEKSAPEIVAALKARLPAAANNVSTNVFINKGDKLWSLDLAVVIDTSHSMGKSIQTIKNNVSGLSGELLNAYWNSRVAVVSYDTALENYSSRVETGFTNDHDSVSNALGNLTVRNNDDNRALYSGLMTAMNGLDWRQGAQKKIIVITDAGPTNPSPDGWTAQDVSNRAYELDPAVLSLTNVSCDDTWSCDESVNDAFQALAAGSNGSVSDANLSFGTTDGLSAALDNMAMQPVAAIDADPTGYIGTPLQLSADRSYDPDAALVSYRWDCNNDGVWDSETTGPNGQCTYNEPYNGLVALQVVSDDGGTATATLPASIIAGQPVVGSVPEQPNAKLTYGPTGTTLTWSNVYPKDTAIRVSDSEGNVLGYAPADAVSVSLPFLGEDMPSLLVAAGNEWGWSDDTTLPLDASKIANMQPVDDAESFVALANTPTLPVPGDLNSPAGLSLAPMAEQTAATAASSFLGAISGSVLDAQANPLLSAAKHLHRESLAKHGAGNRWPLFIALSVGLVLVGLGSYLRITRRV